MHFIKSYDSGRLQVYTCYKSGMESNYRFVYRLGDKVRIYDSDVFPIHLVLSSHGFLFLKNEKVNLPMLPKSNDKYYKTQITDLNKYFIGQDNNVVLGITGYKNCSPKIVYMQFRSYNLTKKDKIDKNNILEDFIDHQPGINTPSEWFDMICRECPGVNYAKKIDSESFAKKITESDIQILYDIRDKDEMSIIENIESQFEKQSQSVDIYDDYNSVVETVTKKCSELNVPYKINKNGSVRLKFSDVNRLGIKWKLTNFI